MKKPVFMLIVAMTIFGTIGIFVNGIQLSRGEIALFRAILAAMVVGLVLLLTKQRIDLKKIKKQLPLLLISGAVMGFNWVLLFQAYQYTTIAVATLSYYFAPVLVTLVCPLLFKEKMGARQWICFAMSTVGLALITGLGDLTQANNHPLGIAFGLGAAVLYAAVMLMNKFIRDVNALQRTFLQFIGAVFVLLPYVLFTGGFHLSTLSGTGWLCLLVLGVVHTGFAYCLYFPSLKALPGQKIAILSYIDPLVAVFLSVAVLHQELSPIQYFGGALILGFTLWNELAGQKTPKKSSPA